MGHSSVQEVLRKSRSSVVPTFGSGLEEAIRIRGTATKQEIRDSCQFLASRYTRF
jgi:hypothetical protein